MRCGTTRVWRPVAATVGLVLSSACSDRPVAEPTPIVLPPPPPETLALVPGRYWLEIFGVTLTERSVPTCRILAFTPGGTSVITPVLLDRAGGDWVASSPPGTGSVELRFRPLEVAHPRGIPLLGTLRGVGYDASPGPTRPVYDNRVIVRGSNETDTAALEGVGSSATSYLSGEVQGQISFADRVGLAATCPSAHWSLQPDR